MLSLKKSKGMNKQLSGIKLLSTDEIQNRLQELETSFAELLADNSGGQILTEVWKEIKVYQNELSSRNN
jgi:hypothetical protein